MSLPLQERVSELDPYFCLLPQGAGGRKTAPIQHTLIPDAAPAAGEQYRFHFDMTKCIGCHCCEVACNEQNNNPADIHWRRVGEIEGGAYPLTKRFYLSMGCNHCLEPTCLTGCPVDAYRKDGASGLVLHSADACIGCQYCTWNCQYGVPQYNSDRGVVGKCDMCYGRLSEGRAPACVNACPEGAIQIETVNIAEWRREHIEADAPGLPFTDLGISTTRITLPENLPADLQKADHHRVRPEHPHTPLVFMTVLTQLAVGALAAIWATGGQSKPAAGAALGLAILSLGASTLHLGRPAFAWRAVKMWRRSWLSREVLLLGLFSMAATVYALSASPAAGAVTTLLGAAGITASAFIYLVPARPAWNSWHTVADFWSTALLLGPLFAAALGADDAVPVGIGGAALQLLIQGLRFLRFARSDEFELRATARLLSLDFERYFVGRFMLLIAGGIVLPLLGWTGTGLALAVTGELLGRYLFFVSVVPRNIARTFQVAA